MSCAEMTQVQLIRDFLSFKPADAQLRASGMAHARIPWTKVVGLLDNIPAAAKPVYFKL